MAFVNTQVYGRVVTDRLTPADWLKQGLRTLTRRGEAALKVGTLAAELHVSRGSFYWHFKDIAEYRAQLLKAWRERATDQIIRSVDTQIVGPARLTQLMKLAFAEDRGLDRSIRAWAAIDRVAAKAVAEVDASRIAYIAKILTESGVSPDKAGPRAEFIYWAYIGQPGVMIPAPSVVTADNLDDLSALFTR